jgi:hypothetical protein
MGKKSIRAIAFILRCSGAATVGYELASSLGLHEALWAAMSAVIVSQEHLHDRPGGDAPVRSRANHGTNDCCR